MEDILNQEINSSNQQQKEAEESYKPNDKLTIRQRVFISLSNLLFKIDR